MNNTRQLKYIFDQLDNTNSHAASQALGAAQQYLVERTQNVLSAHSLLRTLACVESLPSKVKASYPVIDEDGKGKVSSYILPKCGYRPQKFSINELNEIYIPMFNLGASMSWGMDIVREGKVRVAEKEMKRAIRTIIEYEEECLMRVLVAAATNNISSPGEEIEFYRYSSFSHDVIKSIFEKFSKYNTEPSHILISPQDMKDYIMEYGTKVEKIKYANSSNPITRRNIVFEFNKKEYDVTLVSCNQLGVEGRYNINGNITYSSEEVCECCGQTIKDDTPKNTPYGIFRFSNNDKFQDYECVSPNIVTSRYVPSEHDPDEAIQELTIEQEGETQVYGFSKQMASLVMPIRQDYHWWDDPYLHKQRQQGFYGWEEVGVGLLDDRAVCMEVIDRSHY